MRSVRIFLMRSKIMNLLSDIEFYKKNCHSPDFIVGFVEQQLKYIVMDIDSQELVKERAKRYDENRKKET